MASYAATKAAEYDDVAVTGSANPVSNLFTPNMLLQFVVQQVDPTRSVFVV